jgi:hypothetical protein
VASKVPHGGIIGMLLPLASYRIEHANLRVAVAQSSSVEACDVDVPRDEWMNATGVGPKRTSASGATTPARQPTTAR